MACPRTRVTRTCWRSCRNEGLCLQSITQARVRANLPGADLFGWIFIWEVTNGSSFELASLADCYHHKRGLSKEECGIQSHRGTMYVVQKTIAESE